MDQSNYTVGCDAHKHYSLLAVLDNLDSLGRIIHENSSWFDQHIGSRGYAAATPVACSPIGRFKEAHATKEVNETPATCLSRNFLQKRSYAGVSGLYLMTKKPRRVSPEDCVKLMPLLGLARFMLSRGS